jgi:ribosomal protein S18 acetylase RimI-like enzyme
MHHLIAIVRNKQKSTLSLNVFERKTDLYHFYQQFGFQTIKRLPDYYKTSQGSEAALVLELQIDINNACN